jgi:alpha-tubulin suppressor-like RCC1 family protein
LGVQAVGAGNEHTCALATGDVDGAGSTVTGGVFCAGADSLGQNGNSGANLVEEAFFPVSGLSGIVELAVGGYHNCVLHSGGTVSCWGRNNQGQTGQALTSTVVNTPTLVPGLVNVTKIYAQGNLTCALAGGAIRCWGLNDFGQLGDLSASPGAVTTNPQGALAGATSLGLGASHVCAQIGSGGPMYCWGRNQSGQLGRGSSDASAHAVPVQVLSLGN